MNAVRHGGLSIMPVIPPLEREKDWKAHRKGVMASLTPKGHLEAALADRIALLLWRLTRIVRYETAIIDLAQGLIAEDLIRAKFNGADEFKLISPPDPLEQPFAKLFAGEDNTRVSVEFFVLVTSAAAEEAQVDIEEVDLPGVLNEPDLYTDSFGRWTIGLIRQGVWTIAAHAGRDAVDLFNKVRDRFRPKEPSEELQTMMFENECGRQNWERLLPDDQSLGKVIRYEAHLHRQLLQTMHELEALQARRQGRQTPLVRVDAQGLPDK